MTDGGRARGAASIPGGRYAVWGSELSPFALKLRAMMEHADVAYAWLPADGSRVQNLRAGAALEWAKRTRSVERFGGLDPLDEYPLVPFLLETGGPIRYDTSALARFLDHRHRAARGPLIPDRPLEAFIAQLVDEAFDELGLYVVHHRRWVTSALDNDAGARLARELSRLAPRFVTSRVQRDFPVRQVRRLPYLFSVAPEGYSVPGLPRELTPPSRVGFPPTHALLDAIWGRLVDALEELWSHQPYLLGERFTLADASVYGQLGMNLTDPTAADRLRERAPETHAWLCAIRDGEHRRATGEVRYAAPLRPLLEVLGETFVPLMEQNALAFGRARGRVFNERAFDRGEALYEGELCGQPFRSVVKTFQVRVWRDLQRARAALPAPLRAEVPWST